MGKEKQHAITLAEVRKRVKGLDAQTQKSVVCALVGHSKIVTACVGYIHCARCDEQIGDTVCGVTSLKENVIVGHDCPGCHRNYEKLTWRDKYLAPDPFKV